MTGETDITEEIFENIKAMAGVTLQIRGQAQAINTTVGGYMKPEDHWLFRNGRIIARAMFYMDGTTIFKAKIV